MVNRVQLIGRLGKEPEVRHLESGMSVANFTLATSEKFTTKSGEKKEETEWHNIVIWGNLADVVEKWVHKGDQLFLEGKLKTRSYEKDGVTKYVTEVYANGMTMLGGGEKKPTSRTPEVVEDETDNLPF